MFFQESSSVGCVEQTLEQVIASALGLTHFDGTIFLDQITNVIVYNGNRLVITFKDGSTEENYWKDRSRSESWTKDMREAAARKTKERYGK